MQNGANANPEQMQQLVKMHGEMQSNHVEESVDVLLEKLASKGKKIKIIEDGDESFVAEALSLLPDTPFDADTWSSWTTAVKEATGRKGRGLFRPLRLALTGQEHGPEMAALMPLLQVVKAKG